MRTAQPARNRWIAATQAAPLELLMTEFATVLGASALRRSPRGRNRPTMNSDLRIGDFRSPERYASALTIYDFSMNLLSDLRFGKRTRIRNSILSAAALVAGAGALLATRRLITMGPIGNRLVPQPSKGVDLNRYLGRWYELARYDNRFERGCDGVTADYEPRLDGLVAVTNTCRDRRSGRIRRLSKGRAKPVPNSENSKLRVSFFGPFFSGDYWVLDHDDNYTWSIVGEPSGRFLWVLGRDPLISSEGYENLLRRVGALGYDTGLLRKTEQYPI